MSRAWLALRSSLALAAVLFWILVFGSVVLYPFVLPAALILPSRRHRLVSWFMKLICHGIYGILWAAGARCERVGKVNTAQPVLILMNHQSLLDIVTATLMAGPNVPAFVTRTRYGRGLPVVSTSVQLLNSPVIDPQRDAAGAVALMRELAPSQDKGLLIFPEGHRSRTGEIRLFRTAGALAVLAGRPMPVHLLVTDGFWSNRRLGDFVFTCAALRGRTEELGPFPCPEREEDLPAFLEDMRQRMIEHLRMMRERREGVAA